VSVVREPDRFLEVSFFHRREKNADFS
jgi:hypothetical protein